MPSRSMLVALFLGLLLSLGAASAQAQLDQEPTDEPIPGAIEGEPVAEGETAAEQPTDPNAADADDADTTPPGDGGSGPALPSDPAPADALARDESGYEPDQRGTHDDAPDERPESGEPAPPPSAPDSEDRAQSITMSAGAESVAFDEPSFYGFDVQLWLGGGLTSLEAFDNENLVRADQQGGFGANLGLSMGLRMGPITVGPRATLTIDPNFLLVTVGADVRAILSTDAVAPTLRASLSGVFLLEPSDALPSQTGAGGVHAELGAGVRWRFGAGFTFGAEISGGYLHLDRQEETSCTAPCSDGDFDLRESGSSNGLTLRLNVTAGYRF